MRKSNRPIFLAFMFLTVLLSACGSPTTTQPTAIQPTAPRPTSTSEPPTAKPTTTSTPYPPTSTYTATPIPPTATLDPIMGRIEGKVYRSDTNQPFANTSVILRDATYNELLTTTTDTQGYYIFPSIQPGEYGLSVELTFKHPVLSSCNTLKQTGDDWLFVTEVKGGGIELTGVDALSINVSAGEIIEKNLTLICE
jgi:hypothetical protein